MLSSREFYLQTALASIAEAETRDDFAELLADPYWPLLLQRCGDSGLDTVMPALHEKAVALQAELPVEGEDADWPDPKIWTARFTNRTLKASPGIAKIGITVGQPRFPLGYELADRFKELAPWGIYKMTDQGAFEDAYRERLEAVGVAAIKRRLRRVAKRANADAVVLLCYEDVRDPEKHCHRRTLAEWWEEQTGEAIEELPEATPLKTSGAKAPLLPL